MGILVILGIVTDPTTKGIADSERALNYDVPLNDKRRNKMSVPQSIVNWFVNHRGKLTYSMYGSRNGADGTADCSGSISQALKEAGIGIQGLPSTVTLGQQLAKMDSIE